MFKTLAQEWLNLEQNKNSDDVGLLTASVVMDFAHWLDTQRSPTPREAVAVGQNCPSCGGKGNLRNSKEILVVCERCNGTGQF
jgi:hypothetical protein